MLKRLSILAALLTLSGPAWATCELPPVKHPMEPGQLAGYLQAQGAIEAECRRKEEAAAVAQEREDIHAIRHALEEIAGRIGKQ